jgi:uncharacterized protein YkwD
MRWGQVALAATVAIAVAALAHVLEEATVTATVAIGLLSYASVRILIGTFYRSIYWLNRDNPHTSRQCRSCGREIHRQKGDLVVRCRHRVGHKQHKPVHECGWIEGWPITRFFTRSVFARQFRRSISWKRLGVVGLACILLFTPISISVGGMLAGGPGASVAAAGESTPTATERTTAAKTGSETTATQRPQTAPQDVDLNKVERLTVQYVNEERAERGRSKLDRRADLSRVAGEYAQTMAEYERVGHEVGGTTPEERYRSAAVQCQYSGENAAQTAYQITIDTSYGERYYENEDELARGLVEQWVNSPRHRENMFSGTHRAIGVGVEFKNQGGTWYVYAVQDFCR